MKERYKRIGLVTKISFIFILMNFIVLAVFTTVLYSYFQKTVKRYVTNAVDSTIMANTNELENLLHRVEISTYLIHEGEKIYSGASDELSNITQMITSYYPDERNDNLLQLTIDYRNNLKLFNDYFKTCFGEEYSGCSNILFTDVSWPIHVFMPKRTVCTKDNGFSSSLKVKNTEWYRRAEAMDGACYWFASEEDLNRICMAKFLKYRHITKDGEYREDKLGVLTVSFDVSTLAKHLDLNGLTPDAEVLLLNEDDTIVYSNHAERMGMSMPEALKNITPNETWEVYYEERACLVNQKGLPLGLKILTVIPINSIHRITAETIYIIIIVGGVMIGLAVFLTIFLSHTMIAPIKKFAKYMEEGNTASFDFDHSRKDELGMLYRAFDHLMYQLEHAMKRELEANEQKKQAELHALQAQINPHFIYNTLNAISCLAMINQQEHIAELVGNLTKIIRYNIRNSDKLVTVAEEIFIIRQYENIQSSCHYGSVLFEYDIEPTAEIFLIPKLIIQPLVENSLIHSMNYTEKTIKVRISIRTEKDKLVICVWDNGINANVEKINEYITGQVKHFGDSLGVRNVYERIQIVYGDLASLNYEKDCNGNTVAIICIPCGHL